MPGTGWLIEQDGLVPYGVAYEAMHAMARQRLNGEIPDTLILVEHPPVYTAGRRTDPLHVRWTRQQIEAAGAELWDVDRGGSVTFHGPGQLVGYPIVDYGSKPDALGHLRSIEEIIIRACREIGVDLERDSTATGVWSGTRKVCAIGVRLMRARVSLHGFALNCTTDLRRFDAIVPCGLTDRRVTSLSELAGREVSTGEMRPLIRRAFEEVFDVALGSVAAAPWLRSAVSGPVPARV